MPKREGSSDLRKYQLVALVNLQSLYYENQHYRRIQPHLYYKEYLLLVALELKQNRLT